MTSCALIRAQFASTQSIAPAVLNVCANAPLALARSGCDDVQRRARKHNRSDTYMWGRECGECERGHDLWWHGVRQLWLWLKSSRAAKTQSPGGSFQLEIVSPPSSLSLSLSLIVHTIRVLWAYFQHTKSHLSFEERERVYQRRWRSAYRVKGRWECCSTFVMLIFVSWCILKALVKSRGSSENIQIFWTHWLTIFLT
jgi:hypothetical protein